ncbi:MAG: hypothetical protein FK730_03465 [Asgard group archaeon]|nr:hypothetical protein [Asgard group archaeon]
MNTSENEEVEKPFFETRLMSILLMLSLIIMCSLFVVIIWNIFGKDPAINVLIYLSIGIGTGIAITIMILLIASTRKVKMGRNVLLYLIGSILVISLIVSLILRFAISDKELASWAFIDASSVGLGLTTGISLTYLILAMFKSQLTSERKEATKELNTQVESPSEEN